MTKDDLKAIEAKCDDSDDSNDGMSHAPTMTDECRALVAEVRRLNALGAAVKRLIDVVREDRCNQRALVPKELIGEYDEADSIESWNARAEVLKLLEGRER